jgi:hypothetical protein
LLEERHEIHSECVNSCTQEDALAQKLLRIDVFIIMQGLGSKIERQLKSSPALACGVETMKVHFVLDKLGIA